MDQLTIDDLEQILSTSSKAQYDSKSITHIQNFITAAAKGKASRIKRSLTQEEIRFLSTDKPTKIIMIALFLIKNVTIEFLRKNEVPYKSDTVSVQKHWKNIQDLFTKKIFLSRDVRDYFNKMGGINSEKFKNLVNAVQLIEIQDTSLEEFVSNTEDTRIRLLLNGRYDLVQIDSPNNEGYQYTLYDLKICFHKDLYDAFKFEELQTWAAFRHMNNNPERKKIDSIFTLKFAFPELTVLNIDGTFLKVSAEDIPSFLDKNLATNEIDDALYQAIKKEYPRFFLPSMDTKYLNSLYSEIKALIDAKVEVASRLNKPLLILLSEVHGSKESFFLHVIIALIAKNHGITHLLVETINIYHEQYGCDAKVDEILWLISYASDDLGFQIKDLEASLHYNNQLSPYPYLEIPEQEFGIKARESSWIIDAKELNDNNIMIVGSGHLNSILNSELKNMYCILPINCSVDKGFSDMLNISHHNFIELDKSLHHLTLDEIIKMIELSGA
ncbi:MAG: hypothetical protein WC627_08885 [Legionella sp.]|jgi:hypothetical protein